MAASSMQPKWMYRLPIEDLLSNDERRQLEAVRLIALARDLLTDECEQPIKARLDCVLDELDRLRVAMLHPPTVVCSRDGP